MAGDAVEEILGDWLERRERGEAPSPEEVIEAHPELAEELRACFDALLAFDAVAVAEEDLFQVPESIAGYQIRSRIGCGAMGVVYEARDPTADRAVALKLLAPWISRSEEVLARFQREAEAASRLQHDGIVSIFKHGRDQGFLYHAMELVQGPSLDAVIARWRDRPPDGPQHYREVAGMFAAVADALHFAHEHLVIHRDVKPSNILLPREGPPKLTDFGLARTIDARETLTEDGRVLGTLQYMSPEQALGRRDEIREQSDVYALGATLYEALTLRPPFQGDRPTELLLRIASESPDVPRRVSRSIPRDLETITLKAMARSRADRYLSAAHMAEDLRRFQAGERIRARRPWATRPLGRHLRKPVVWGGLAFTGLALVLGVVLAAGGDRARPGLGGYDPRGRSAREVSAATGWTLEEAGLPGDARIVDWTPFSHSGWRLGTILVAEGSALELCAVDADGEHLWNTGGSGRGYSETLGRERARYVGMRVLTLSPGQTPPEEILALSVGHRGGLSVLLIGAAKGDLRGTWAYPDPDAAPIAGARSIAVLPGSHGRSEHIVVVGQGRCPARNDRHPSVAVLDASARMVQRLTLPVLGVKSRTEASACRVRTSWDPECPEVIVETTEGLLFSFLADEERLDRDSAVVWFADAVPRNYDDVKGEGAFDARAREAGGRSALRRLLACEVLEVQG